MSKAFTEMVDTCRSCTRGNISVDQYAALDAMKSAIQPPAATLYTPLSYNKPPSTLCLHPGWSGPSTQACYLVRSKFRAVVNFVGYQGSLVPYILEWARILAGGSTPIAVAVVEQTGADLGLEYSVTSHDGTKSDCLSHDEMLALVTSICSVGDCIAWYWDEGEESNQYFLSQHCSNSWARTSSTDELTHKSILLPFLHNFTSPSHCFYVSLDPMYSHGVTDDRAALSNRARLSTVYKEVMEGVTSEGRCYACAVVLRAAGLDTVGGGAPPSYTTAISGAFR